MAEHPLTFQMCKQIIGKELAEAMLHTTTRLYESGYDKGWDTGYDKGYDKGMEDRLEQMLEWLRHNLHLMPTTVDYVVEGLREAMRPEDN